jgi:signal transduction histidine kinase
MNPTDTLRRTRRLQGVFLGLLTVTTVLLGWWLVDQVRYTGAVLAEQEAGYARDSVVARALLLAGHSWRELNAEFPALTISADSAMISVSPLVLDDLRRQRFHRLNRYAWEGTFFLAVLIGAMVIVVRAIREEAELRRGQEQFLAGMSHELKSPLASLRLSVETLAMRDPPPAQRGELVRRMLVELGRLQGTIANVLDTSRLAAAGRGTPEPIALAGAMAQVIEELADFAAECEVTIDDGVAGDLTVLGERDGTHLVLRNLVHNAIKASPPGRTVRVRGSAVNGTVVLEVQDQGSGFSPEEAARLFEKFYRIDREDRGRTRGTGLGLFLVRRHVELDRGTVVAASDGPGQGATFTVIWPAAGTGGS